MNAMSNLIAFPGVRNQTVIQLEADTVESYPEQRLWCAVIMSALDEYQDCLQRISSSWHTHQRAVNRNYLEVLRNVRKSCDTPWFGMVCELADISPHRVIQRLDSLDREFCLSAIPFETEDTPYMSDYERRKFAKTKRTKYLA